MEPSTTNKRNIYSDICRRFPTTSSGGNKYIYIIYIYDCNAIPTTSMKNISYKEIIIDFTELTEDLKSRRINPGIHFMDNDASIALNMTMPTVNIEYRLVPPSNQ